MEAPVKGKKDKRPGISKKLKEEILKPLLQTRKCVKCNVDNAPVSMFCYKCGEPLSLLTMSSEELTEHIMKIVREAE